jgi:hypothetical protein
LANGFEVAAIAGCTGEGGKMNYAQKAPWGKDSSQYFFGGGHGKILRQRAAIHSYFWRST